MSEKAEQEQSIQNNLHICLAVSSLFYSLDSQRGGKKIEENKKRYHCLCPLQKMWLWHLWNTADTAVTREETAAVQH